MIAGLPARVARGAVAGLAAAFVTALRWSVRIRIHRDPRPRLRREGRRYAYAVLHCHQIAAVIAGEPGTGAMVSRSADGDLLIPSLRAQGIVPVRGSTRVPGKNKGGAAALERLIEHVESGAPAYLAVDGPRGPRNHVHAGIARLAQETGAAVVLMVPVPTRRWILTRTWDRLQIPKPFARIDYFFAPPLACGAEESVEAFRKRVEEGLQALELACDPAEAAVSA